MIDSMLYNILHRSVNAMKDIPAIIKAARVRTGMTQQELGEKMGYEGLTAQVSVRRWESGAPSPSRRSAPSLPLSTSLSMT